MTKFRIVISTLIVTVGSLGFLGTAAAHADDAAPPTNQFYAPAFVPTTLPPVTTTVPSVTTPPTSPPTTAHGSTFIPSVSTTQPSTAVKVITVSQPAAAAPLAATGALAFTGADVAGLVGIAFLLLIVGAELIRRTRRRAPSQS